MANNRTVFLPHQNKTYIYDNGGNLVSILDGDHSSDPVLTEFAARSAGSLKGSKGGNAAIKQNTKDFLVDLASQVPLATIPGSGPLATGLRGGTSLLSGLISDQVLNGDKTVGDSLSDAGVNTALGMTVNHLIKSPPNLENFSSGRGYGIKGILDGIVKTMMGKELIPEMAPTTPVVRGAKGKYVSNMAQYKEYLKNKGARNVLNLISNTLGFGANAGLDAANNESLDNIPPESDADQLKQTIKNIPQQPVPTKPVTVTLPGAQPTADNIQQMIKDEATKQDVDPNLALAVARQESQFKPEAKSKKGALGVFQLMPDTAESLGVDPNDLGQNIQGGVKLLGQLMKKYKGDRVKALVEYNAGPGVADHLPAETSDYIQKILGSMNE